MQARSAVFDYARLAGAVMVLVGHAYVLLGLQPPTIAGTGIHEIGVKLFFAISGYLIAASWTTDPQFWRFAEKRARRIMPALLVVVAATVFVVGPIMTTAPDYWRDPVTWRYLWRNSLLLPFHSLPGVFGDNPLPAVNGSLWTLPVEAFCYVLTPALVMARAPLCIALAVALLAFPFTGEVAGFGLAGASNVIPWFLIGAAARQLGVKAPAVRLPALPVDLSYGLYLTAFPVTQIVIAMKPQISAPALIAVVTAYCLPLAWLSWTFVERPAIRMRSTTA